MSARDRALLFTWSRSQTLAARVVLRSRIVLMLADGEGVKTIATAAGGRSRHGAFVESAVS